ncbi:Holliday junction branch migration DNA helicase RuvB [Candidatus Gracilibacteria bacterium]|nr:Holliday junction branch migration DNA helicase RuvB [Candidatus Gracilibacteria bacterium]
MIEREENEAILGGEVLGFEEQYENRLRPLSFTEYIGQDLIKDNLAVAMQAAKKREEPLDHLLLHGAPGLGKTTLAAIVAKEFGVNLRVTAGPALEKSGDLASILSNLEANDILFIDEIHRLKPIVEEVLYSAMEDFALDIVLGKGPAARTVRIALPRFTLIGATTKLSMISSPLRDRFGSVFKLQGYEPVEIQRILMRSSRILGVDLDDDLALELARSCRRTPRIANRLLRRVRDFADVHNDSRISRGILNETLGALGIDELGLDQADREILRLMIDKFDGGPVGLNTLSAALNEEQATLEDIYEPFLIQQGLLQRTPRGRVVTDLARSHVG